MFAKQTLSSASLVVVLVGAAVIAHADPAPEGTGTFEVGAGFSSYEGFVARTRVEQSSLFGSGHMLALDATVSRWRQNFRINYGTTDLGGGLTLHAELFNEKRQLPAFVRHGTGGALTLQQQLGPNLRAFIGYRYEVVQEPTVGRIASVRAGMIYKTRESDIGLTYELADRRLGSDFTFDRVHAWVARHQPIGPLTLHLTGSFEQLMGAVPLSERMFINGLTDLRGYAPGALAPLGATSKLSGRAELEVPLVRRIGLSAVGFVDAATIGDKTFGASGASAGFGLVWRSPIGTLRFDWAVPLDGGEPRFLFGLGGTW